MNLGKIESNGEGIKGCLISFESKGIMLDGFLVGKIKPKKTIVIFIHGMNGNFYKSPLIKEFMKKSIEEDFDFLSIDNRGKEIISRFYGKKKLVLGTALVLKKGYKHIILAGYSTGCQKIVYYINMRKNKHVQALVFMLRLMIMQFRIGA